METTVEKDLIIARQNSQIEEMILFMSHLDLCDTICAKMAKLNGEEEYGVCQCSCEECIRKYFIGN